RAAIDHLATLDDQRLDLDDATLIGHSAGGQLALCTASRDDSPIAFKRVIAQAPVTNLVLSRPRAHDPMGGPPHEPTDRYASCTPMQLVPRAMPVAVVHGEDDMTIPLARSRDYVAAARAAGGDAELIEPTPGPHRSHIDPRSESWRTAVGWLTNQRSTSQPV